MFDEEKKKIFKNCIYITFGYNHVNKPTHAYYIGYSIFPLSKMYRYLMQKRFIDVGGVGKTIRSNIYGYETTQVFGRAMFDIILKIDTEQEQLCPYNRFLIRARYRRLLLTIKKNLGNYMVLLLLIR